MEDDPDFIYLIRQAIDRCGALSFLAAARSGEEGVALTRELRPHIVLMDINLPGGIDGVAAARAIRLTTEGRVLMLTSCEDPEMILDASKRAFASGYIFKSHYQTLVDIICHTAEGQTPQATFIRELVLSALSSAERSIVEMLLKGDMAVASSEKTIANQKTSIFHKLNLRGTAELIHVFKYW